MDISFSKIIPFPLPDSMIKESQVWDKEFVISEKENILICAESGKGKTTFINILFGLRKDYSGSLLIENKNIKNFGLNELSELRKKKLSIVPQGLLLFDELSVIENIIIKNNLSDFLGKDDILKILEAFDLLQHKDKKAKFLSYGQKQRLAIIRALCQPYDYILLDEPFSHLDDKNKNNALRIISENAEKQNAGIIITSLHDNIELNFSKKIIV